MHAAASQVQQILTAANYDPHALSLAVFVVLTTVAVAALVLIDWYSGALAFACIATSGGNRNAAGVHRVPQNPLGPVMARSQPTYPHGLARPAIRHCIHAFILWTYAGVRSSEERSFVLSSMARACGSLAWR
jgi:hypothetical protein